MFVVLLIVDPSSQELGPPAIPGRFSARRRRQIQFDSVTLDCWDASSTDGGDGDLVGQRRALATAISDAGINDIRFDPRFLSRRSGQWLHDRSITRLLFSHAAPAIAWDAFAFAETLLTQPMLLVFGDKPGGFGAYRDGMEIYGRAAASKDRQLVVVEGFSHYDLYDKPEPVRLALEKITPFFRTYLGEPMAP